MKLYKIRGTSEWVPWDVLYNERGYNSVPCIDMEYKSISPWGTSAGTGYRTNGSGDATYFVSGKTGWYLAYSLPGALGVYPDEATPIQMIKDGVVSDAVWMEFWGAKWYLIQAEIANERYWIIEHGLSELGWEIYEGKDYEFILVDGTTGRVVHGVEQLNEMVFAPTGYFTIEDTGDIVFVEQSPYPIVSRFHVDFDTVQTLADGAYIDTVLPYYTSKLYIAGIVNRVAETVVDFGLTVSNEGGYVRVTNNTGASVTLTRLAIQSMDATDAEVVEVVDGQDNHAYAFKWNDSGTPYWWISYSGERHWTDALGAWSEIPVVSPKIEVMLNLSRSMNTVTFSANDYWASYAQLTVTVNALNDFGVPLRELNGAKFISAAALSDFSFEPVGLYAYNGTDVHADMSNFYCAAGGNNPDSDYGNNVNIFSINAYSVPVFTWKCRITKNL